MSGLLDGSVVAMAVENLGHIWLQADKIVDWEPTNDFHPAAASPPLAHPVQAIEVSTELVKDQVR